MYMYQTKTERGMVKKIGPLYRHQSITSCTKLVIVNILTP